jgi:transcriptional regulator GlxA family with amidase domain
VTLLPSEAAAVDGTPATQLFLVRTYLERVRRRPLPVRTGAAPLGAEPPKPSSHFLEGVPRSSNPSAVRSAITFIEANAAQPIGLAEIAAAAQLSPRALQAAFRRHLGTTPLNHLRAVRLSRVHDDLQAARPGDGQTVSDIASRWGFSQLSRFAREYQRRYGVTPHQSLRAARP